MAINPSKQGEALNSPIERASKLNDTPYANDHGYFSYDLTHQECLSPLYGYITPTMNLDTVPADRIVLHDDTKTILNQIDGNFLSTINQYVDSFYVSARNVFPNNYEKIMVNPVKGDDIPNTALPVVPFLSYLRQLYRTSDFISFDGAESSSLSQIVDDILDGVYESIDVLDVNDQTYLANRLVLLCTVLSRGQLLDYLGFQLDTDILRPNISSELQYNIDRFFSVLWKRYAEEIENYSVKSVILESSPLSLTSQDVLVNDTKEHYVSDLSSFRNAIADVLEAGRFITNLSLSWYAASTDVEMIDVIKDLLFVLDKIFSGYEVTQTPDHLTDVNALPDMRSADNINIGKILAYQMVVAQYYTNDKVDNVYNADLFMQNLRSVMYPTVDGDITTTEPTFEMNGVRYEYDYISYGGFWSSLLTNYLVEGCTNRQWVWATVMLLLRRSLRYGDYFTTARPNMLAVSDQLSIAVEDGMVSPIDVTKNLLLQRYLNAANYVGQNFLRYFSSMFGVKPSDTGTVPRFISHRKITLDSQITNNTADNQGKQTTNLVGFSDASGFDVFIDDFGYIFTLTSFDVLPIYKSGISSTFYLADRFDYFNPMMQGIGDVPILSSEILGFPELHDSTFGYTMRNKEYKWKLSKAHGAFCNSLPGFLLTYPLYAYNQDWDGYELNINPDIIRDKPVYMDSIVPQMTGVSPAEYYHFIQSTVNEVKCARKIQAMPSVLF